MKQRKSPFVGTLSLVMLLLAGCSQEVVINDSPNARSGKYIAFNPLIEKSDTRAEVITNDNLESFAVWAAGELPALTENLVLNDVLVYRNKENKWVYNPEVLWSASTMDFYAYAPALSTNVKSTFAPNGSTITYTVKQEKNKGVINQEDFLVAYKKKVDRNAGTVVLQFQHALSRARFEARSGVEGVNLIIKKVELHNLKAVGDLDFENAGIPSSGGFTYDDINHTPLVTLWTNQRSPINYDVARTRDSGESNSFIMVDNTMTQIHTDANALMVLPQQTVLAVIDQSNGNVTNINGEDTNPSSGDEPFYISVVWALSTNPSQEMTTNFPVLFPGLDTKLEFEAGRQYTFHITLTKEDGVSFIQMTPEVSDWNLYGDHEDSGETPVPVPRYSVGGMCTDKTLIYETNTGGTVITKEVKFKNTYIDITLTALEVVAALGKEGDMGTVLTDKFKEAMLGSDVLNMDIQPNDVFWQSVNLPTSLLEASNNTDTGIAYNMTNDIMVLNSITDGGRDWPGAVAFATALANNGTLNTLDYWMFDGTNTTLTSNISYPFTLNLSASDEGCVTQPTGGLKITGYINWEVKDGKLELSVKKDPTNKAIMYVATLP